MSDIKNEVSNLKVSFDLNENSYSVDLITLIEFGLEVFKTSVVKKKKEVVKVVNTPNRSNKKTQKIKEL